MKPPRRLAIRHPSAAPLNTISNRLRALRGSTVCRELFAHDLAHELLSYRGIHQPKMGSERVVDQGLIALSGFFGLGLEALESRVIDINGNTRFLGGRNHRATLAFGKVIYLFHNSFAP